MATTGNGIPPPAALMQLITGRFATQMVAAAAHLRIADRLKDGPASAETVATAAGSNPDATYRLMRGLSSLGVLIERDGRTFSLTPVGECLRSDAPNSLAGMAKFMGEPWHALPWSHLPDAVMTGGSAFEKAHGAPAFPWFRSHPKEFAIFTEAMTSNSRTESAVVVKAYPCASARSIADVGGGQGFFLSSILAANPNARGVLFDLPEVVQGAGKVLSQHGVEQRCEVVGGDFFESAPAGCDLYLIKHIIHDWPDEPAVRILSRVAAAMAPGGRVAVVENVVTPPNVPHFTKLLDMEMLVMTSGGRERTEREYAALFEKAGLRLTRVIPTEGPVSIVEAERRP